MYNIDIKSFEFGTKRINLICMRTINVSHFINLARKRSTAHISLSLGVDNTITSKCYIFFVCVCVGVGPQQL